MNGMIHKKWWLIISLLVLASCKITQPYHQPQELISDSLFRNNVSDSNTMANVPWTQLFPDTLLQSLISEGLKNNPDLQVALTRIRVAQVNLLQSKAAFLPDVDATLSATAQKLTTSQAGHSRQYEAYAGASWEMDIWGKLKSGKRAQVAALLQSEAYRRAVQTQLISDIATDYYTLLGYDSQLQVTLRTVENRKLEVETVKALKESDVVNGAAVVQSEANRYAAEVTIPDLRQNIRQTENSISVMLGRDPGPIVRDSLSHEQVYADLHTGMPLQLLSNRPDVQEAEYQFRYNFELTNVARTYFYPALTITAEGGLYNSGLTNLFNTTALFGNIVGGLTQPIFNRGLNKQRFEVAKAQQDEALITFKQTLLSAGSEVSNALYDYQAAGEKITLRMQQIAYLEKAVDYTKELLKYTNTTNFTDVLTSEQSLLAAQLNHISDRLQQLQAVVNLYRSLGGGWK
jgi:multidrug efflux system outer membrane protein